MVRRMIHERLADRRISTLKRRYDDDTPVPPRRPPATAPTRASAPAPAVDNMSVTGEGLTFADLAAYVEAGIASGLSPDAALTGVVAEDGRLLHLRVKVRLANPPAAQPAPVEKPTTVVIHSATESTEDAVARGLAEMQERRARVAPKRPGTLNWS